MVKLWCFCLLLWIMKGACSVRVEMSTEEAFSILFERIDSIEREASDLKSNLDENIATMKAQVGDIAEEFNDMSEQMNTIFGAFAEDGNDTDEEIKTSAGMKRYISALVQQELRAEKENIRRIVDRYEEQFEKFGSYISHTIAKTPSSAEKRGIGNEIPMMTVNSENHCDMCMLVATTAEMKVRRLEQELEALTNETIDIAESYDELQSHVGYAMDKVREMEEYQIESLRNTTEDVDELRDFVYSLSEKHERKIGFTARYTKVRSFIPGNTLIVFDEVKYNYGDGYNPTTGIFTAPQTGTYLLSFNVQSTTQYDAHVCLIVDGALRLTAVAGRGHRITGGNTGIVYMEEGEQAWVRTTTLKPRFGIWPHRTTFSGVLLD